MISLYYLGVNSQKQNSLIKVGLVNRDSSFPPEIGYQLTYFTTAHENAYFSLYWPTFSTVIFVKVLQCDRMKIA